MCTGLLPAGGNLSLNNLYERQIGDVYQTLPRWFSGKEPPANAGDLGSIPGSGRSPGEGNDNPLQYSHLGNPMNRGAWQATVHGVVKSRTRLSD